MKKFSKNDIFHFLFKKTFQERFCNNDQNCLNAVKFLYSKTAPETNLNFWSEQKKEDRTSLL